MATYTTKQQKAVLDCLSERADEPVSAAAIADALRERGEPIGIATVYRQLERMVDEGLIAKYNIDVNTPACFEYLGSHLGEETCYHCKCCVCGKLIHMHCDELPELQKHVLEHHGFSIDPVRTIFYGVCSDCAEKKK